MREMSEMMMALQRFCERHAIRPPASIELKFNNSKDANDFETAMLMEFDKNNNVVDFNARRVSKICQVPISVTYSKIHGKEATYIIRDDLG